MKILLLSDTHAYIDDKILKYCAMADEVWHAGDIGNRIVTDRIKEIKPLRAVYGNIDDKDLRAEYPIDQIFTVEGVKVWMTHIAGYPKRYSERVKKLLKEIQPKLMICGHSHILKVQFDQENKMLHMNPGACGISGFHQVRTLLRFDIEKGDIKNLEVIELGKRI
ncbi:metallophosphoesterase family protein [Namhaeicola litoreus]|uniref:Phosphoesterase n=1 Tax=Namhaeicola litoreus TaxID=1052145 RepID=A0ABW3Y7D2_9FLAO